MRKYRTALIVLCCTVATLGYGVTKGHEPPRYEQTISIGDADAASQAYVLEISNVDGETVVTINMLNGGIAYGEGYGADTAARAFWNAVSLLVPPCPSTN